MRRALVLTDERRRHPFLASLPPHVRRTDPEAKVTAWRLTRTDVRHFAATYVAGFLAVSTFIT